MEKSCGIDLRVAGSRPAGQLLIYFHSIFPVLTKTLMSTFKFSSQVPHQSFRAQTAVLLPPTSSPCFLLKFIAAERNNNWQGHLPASTEMVPYDRAFGHPQYFRWGLIYLAEMMNLPTFAPEVNTAFQINKHWISRSSSKSYYNADSTGKALEQSQVKDSKSA